MFLMDVAGYPHIRAQLLSVVKQFHGQLWGYVVLNDAALHMAKGLAIEDHPPKCTTKNFNAHLALTLTCQQDLLQTPEVDDNPGHYI